MTAEFLEQDVCIGNGITTRCADCERQRALEADGRCSECLHFRTVPVKAHVPMPRYRVNVRKGAEIVYGPADVVQETAVIKIRDWFQEEPDAAEYTFSVDYINSKAGVLR
jgi:hypothetical protein